MYRYGPTWLEIDLDAIASNVKIIKEFVGPAVNIMGIVKDNGYGHDSLEVSNVLVDNNVPYLGVARVDEGIELRRANFKTPILILGVTLQEQMESLLINDLTPTVCDLSNAANLSKLAYKMNKRVKIHVKIDTGLGRIGIYPEDALNFIKGILDTRNLEIEGIFTHFATSENDSYTHYQLKIFIDILTLLKREGIKIPLKHVANSAATLCIPQAHFNMIRPGLILYGYYRSYEHKQIIKLKPSLKFKTRVVFVKTLPAGQSVGYDRTYTSYSDIVVATLSAGYGDGYPRSLSNTGEVIIKGNKAKIIGRLSQDQVMVDATHINNVEAGDEVILWEGETILQSALAANTNVDEILIGTDKKRVPKVFIKNGKPYKIKSFLGEKSLT